MHPYDSSTLARNQRPTATQEPPISHEPPISSISTTKPKRSRNHINLDGQLILDEYLRRNPDGMPPSEVRNALVTQIKNCGNEFYAMSNITSWFKRHAMTAPSSYSDTYPSLTKSMVDNLEILIKNTSNPSSDVVKTWASLLSSSGAKQEDVVNWVHSRLNKAPTARLPTPANTATPEPSLPPSSPTFYEHQIVRVNVKQSPIEPSLPPSSPTFYEHQIVRVNVKQSPIASPISLSPNLPSNAYPSTSQVPGHRQIMQVSPTNPPMQVDNNVRHYRKPSISSDISVTTSASPMSPTSSTSPSSATSPHANYRPYHQWTVLGSENDVIPQVQTGSSNFKNAPVPPLTSRPVNTQPSRPSSARPMSPEAVKPKQPDHFPRTGNLVLQAIIDGFKEAPSNSTGPPTPVPTTSAEYKAAFAAYEKQLSHMKQILDK